MNEPKRKAPFVIVGRDKGDAAEPTYWTGKKWSPNIVDAMRFQGWSARMASNMLEHDYPWMIIYPSRREEPKQDWTPRDPWLGGARRNPDDFSRIPVSAHKELEDAEARAHEAGAPDALDLIGVGMFGIVFCDDRGHAWKVGRLERPSDDRSFIRESLGEEYEWLRDAATTPIAGHVAKVYAFYPGPVVLERECVRGEPGGWNDGRKLSELHKKIEAAMLPAGWTAPEFKENSYIVRPNGPPVLVDASMPQRVGQTLVRYVEDVIDHRRTTRDRWHDLAFYILREMGEKTIPREVGLPLLERLAALDPEIRRSFSW